MAWTASCVVTPGGDLDGEELALADMGMQSGRAVLEMCCVLQPEPVCMLLLQGRWREVLVLARAYVCRRHGRTRRLLHGQWGTLIPEYPSRSCVRGELGNLDCPVDSRCAEPLAAEKPVELQCDLRQRAGLILGAARLDGELGQVEEKEASLSRHALRSAVWERTLRGEVAESLPGLHKHDARILLSVLSASRLLRNRGAAQKALRALLDAHWLGLACLKMSS